MRLPVFLFRIVTVKVPLLKPVPDAVEVGRTHAPGVVHDPGAAAIVRERDVKRLVQIADPVSEKLQGPKPRRVGASRRRQDLEVGTDRGEEAPGPLWT